MGISKEELLMRNGNLLAKSYRRDQEDEPEMRKIHHDHAQLPRLIII